jgi:hypothetical protein
MSVEGGQGIPVDRGPQSEDCGMKQLRKEIALEIKAAAS